MILVTGGLGFIGSHIALSLMAQGQEVVLVDNLANSTLQTLERLEYISGMYVPFVKLDVRNTPALNKVFEQYSIDAVIHTAGFKSIEESNLKPLEYYNDNVSCIM
ncbi:UDP-glucose 4-epimerase, partial [Acinetobacter baumannii]|nr:UDP-glucose 4-epimerase [Acinetobacter baumannii]